MLALPQLWEDPLQRELRGNKEMCSILGFCGGDGDEEEIEVDGKRYKGFFGRLNGEMRLLFKDINEGLNKHLLEPLMKKLGAEGPLDFINKGLQYIGIDVAAIWKNFTEGI